MISAMKKRNAPGKVGWTCVCENIILEKIHWSIPMVGPWECYFSEMLIYAVEVGWGIDSMIKVCKLSQGERWEAETFWRLLQ